MSKRFSETDKWKDEWFAGLPPIQKLVFLFFTDNCDNAGFIEINPRVNSFLIGISEEEYLGAIEGLNRGCLGAKFSKILWVKNFLFHQKNLPLNPENNAHKQIINLIKNRTPDFDIDFNKELGASEGLFSPTGRGKGKGKEDRGVGKGTETTSRKKFTAPSLDEFKAYFKQEGFREDVAERAWKAYTAADWHDTNGKPVKNWKQKCQNVWFREDHKITKEHSLKSAAAPDTATFFNTGT